MIGWTIDSWSQSLCRGVYDVFGGFPTSCTVNGGRPFLYLVAALAVLAFVVGSFIRRRLRATGEKVSS